jgi:hypothetical protein
MQVQRTTPDSVSANFYCECKFSKGTADSVNDLCSLCRSLIYDNYDTTMVHIHYQTVFCTDCFLARVDRGMHRTACTKCKQRLECLGSDFEYREGNVGLFPGFHYGKATVALDVPSVHQYLGGYEDDVSLVHLWDDYEEKYWDRTEAVDKLNVCCNILTDLLVNCGEDPNRFDLNMQDMYTIWKCSRIVAVRAWLEIKFKVDSTRVLIMPQVSHIEVKESFENAIKEKQLQEAMQSPSITLHIPVPSKMLRDVLR